MIDKGLLAIHLSTLLNKTVVVKNAIASDVNLTYTIEINGRDYIAKLMTRKPLSVIERYRFVHSKQLIDGLADELQLPVIEYVDTTLHNLNGTIIYSILILEKINGVRLDIIWGDLDDEQKHQFARSFGRTMNKIHDLTFSNFGLFDIDTIAVPSYSNWQEYVINRVDNAVDILNERNLIDANLLERAKNYIYDTQSDWQYTGPPRLVHSDLWQGNIIVDPDDLSSYSLLDWEWAYPGDPIMDLIELDVEMFPSADTEILDSFYSTYKLDSIDVKQKLTVYHIFAQLVGAAFGFLYHNPSPSGYDRIAKTLQSLLN